MSRKRSQHRGGRGKSAGRGARAGSGDPQAPVVTDEPEPGELVASEPVAAEHDEPAIEPEEIRLGEDGVTEPAGLSAAAADEATADAEDDDGNVGADGGDDVVVVSADGGDDVVAVSADDAAALAAEPDGEAGAEASQADGELAASAEVEPDLEALAAAELGTPSEQADLAADEVGADGEDAEGVVVMPLTAASMPDGELKNLLEALVFAGDKPLTMQRLRQLTRVADTDRLARLLDELAVDCQQRGVILQQVSGGYVFRTQTRFSTWVQQLIAGRPVRLSRAQLETLAIVAYRQPITRPEIDDIRGVDSGATLKLLLDRALIRVLGKKEEPGRPILYGTTKEFLDFFSLQDLRELPTLREYSDLTAESRDVVRKAGLEPMGGQASDEAVPEAVASAEGSGRVEAPVEAVGDTADDAAVEASGDGSVEASDREVGRDDDDDDAPEADAVAAAMADAEADDQAEVAYAAAGADLDGEDVDAEDQSEDGDEATGTGDDDQLDDLAMRPRSPLAEEARAAEEALVEGEALLEAELGEDEGDLGLAHVTSDGEWRADHDQGNDGGDDPGSDELS